MSDAPGRASLLLSEARGGSPRALSEFIHLIYPDLRRIAAQLIRRERGGHTLQPTALVHEAYLRVIGGEPISLEDQHHLMAVLAQSMRRVLVDHARKRGALKREQPLLFAARGRNGLDAADLLTLERALVRLEEADPAKARVVELRFFGGLSTDEIAKVMQIAPRTVKRYWSAARVRLYQDIAREKAHAAECAPPIY